MQAPLMSDVTAILPTLVLVLWGTGLLLVALVTSRARQAVVVGLGLIGLGVALVVSLLRWDNPTSGFNNTIVLDNYSLFLSLVSIIAGLLTTLLSFRGTSSANDLFGCSEYYALLLFSVSGMTLASCANDLIILFLALELFSIPLYVLVSLASVEKSKESALKYFLLGTFASAFLIYGIALVYGGSGTTALAEIGQGAVTGNPGLVLVGAGLILVGLAFKVAAVPFHAWAPDVYEGTLTPVTSFIAVGTKTAGFAALGRVFLLSLASLGDDWTPAVAILAALSMILGNVVALSQGNLKRMLAYSSIAHSGYVLIGIATRGERGLDGMLFYLLAYALATLGAFAVLAWPSASAASEDDWNLTAYAGLSRQRPWLAAAMTLFMFSLVGLPPSGGFVGKYYLFWAAVEADLIWLAILGVLTSLISASFYLRVVATMYLDAPTRDALPPTRHPALLTALVLAAAGTLILGLWPGPLVSIIKRPGLTALFF